MNKHYLPILCTMYYVLSTAPDVLAQDIPYGDYNRAIGVTTGDSIGSIINSFLPTVLTIAGLILFGMLVAGGFTMLAGAADKESQEKGKKQITAALTGFFIIFLSYWIAQILQVIFKVNILS